MDSDVQELVQSIHDAPPRVVLVTAGAGAQALAWLLAVPGASRTLIEGLVPYDANTLDDFLGQTPRHYVAADTAALLAGRALARGRRLRPAEVVIGLACTAAIVSDRPKRGDHRAHVATWRPDRVTWHTLELEKGARDRIGEEKLVSRVILNALAQAYQLNDRLILPLGAGDRYAQEACDLAGPAAQLHGGQVNWFGVQASGRLWAGPARDLVLLSGSFNPLHDGHLGLAQAAASMTGRPLVFELPAINANKPSLALETILERLAQFAGRWPVLASAAPTFAEKARLFPGTVFAVGYDTAVRVLQPRFYQDSQEQMAAALSEIRHQGCSFLVAGRVDEEGTFHDASQLAVPQGFADLFRAIPARRFRRDVSSTELRAAGAPGGREERAISPR